MIYLLQYGLALLIGVVFGLVFFSTNRGKRKAYPVDWYVGDGMYFIEPDGDVNYVPNEVADGEELPSSGFSLFVFAMESRYLGNIGFSVTEEMAVSSVVKMEKEGGEIKVTLIKE